MSGKTIANASFILGAWLLFRFVSDWPRGASGSGIFVAEYLKNISYFGLVVWLAMAAIGLLSVTNFYKALFSDRIARAHVLFIVFQFVGLYIISRDFGNEGLIAGCYIIMVTISFLMAYLLGIEAGRLFANETVGQGSQRFLRWITLCLAPCLAVGALQLFTGTGRDVGGIPRIYGGTSSPNVLAALLLVYLGLVLWSGDGALTNTRKALIALTLTLFVACFSMAGIGVLLGMFGVFWLVSGLKEKRLRIRFSWAVGGLLAVAVTLFFASHLLAERYAELGNSDNSLTWRTRTWMSYLELLADKQFFLVGGGLGFDHLGLAEEPHNEWLRVLLETGFIGLCLFVRIWWSLIRSLFEITNLPDRALRRRAFGIIAVTGGLVVWAMADSVIRTAPSALLLWGSVGVLVGSARSYYQRLAPAAQIPVPSSGGSPGPTMHVGLRLR